MKKTKRTYVSSHGVTFVEKPDIGIKIGSGVNDFTVHHWLIAAEPNLKERTFIRPGRIENRDWKQDDSFEVHYRLFSKMWFKFLFIPYLKFKVVRRLYKSSFDKQLKQKGKRCGLKIIKQRPRS